MHRRAPSVRVQPSRGPRYRIERRPTPVAGLSQGNRLHCTPSIPAAPAGRAASARPVRSAENEPGREAGGKAMSRRAILTGPSSRLARARPTAQRLSSRSAPQRGLRRSRLAALTVLSVAGVLLRREWNSRRDGQSQSEWIVPGVLVPFRMDTPLLGWETGSARSAPPALRPGAQICERRSPSSSCDLRAAVMASLQVATL